MIMGRRREQCLIIDQLFLGVVFDESAEKADNIRVLVTV
jgi:hypothetical protein